MELKKIGNGRDVVECVDNDETAAVISELVKAKTLVILTSVEGIYRDKNDASTLVREITGTTSKQLDKAAAEIMKCCSGSSRTGSSGAGAKLKYSLGPAKAGTHVYISSAENRIDDIIFGRADSTHIYLKER